MNVIPEFFSKTSPCGPPEESQPQSPQQTHAMSGFDYGGGGGGYDGGYGGGYDGGPKGKVSVHLHERSVNLAPPLSAARPLLQLPQRAHHPGG